MSNSQGIDPEKLDSYMQRGAQPDDDGIVWRSPDEPPFRLAGFAWFERDRRYRRLPVTPSHPIRHEVDSLANCTAGGQIRFRTNAKTVALKATLAGPAGMYHMAPTGQCGFDCYVAEPGGEWLYCGTSRLAMPDTNVEHRFIDLPERPDAMREILIHFPLYQGVHDVRIGVDDGAAIEPAASFADDRKVVVYGTSITQGGCASRPGLLPTNVWSRRLSREFINLGFSGNGRGEPELARIICEIERPALLVLDYVSNAQSPERYAETLPEFVRICREKHEDAPILILSRIPYAADRHQASSLELRERYRDISRDTADALRRSGDRRVAFCDGTQLLGDNCEECTVDGIHPTDLGFMRIADALTPVLSDLLAAQP